MNFTVEQARTQSRSAEGLIRSLFSGNPGLKDGTILDAEYLEADRSRAFGFAGLPFRSPVCSHLANDRIAGPFIGSVPGSFLLVLAGDALRLYTEQGESPIPEDAAAAIRKTAGRVLASRGELNEKGELILDLKAYPVGPHYPVNLLLGNREGYPMPLVSTPKSALDALGRGSFRGAGAQQVLATRYVLQPEENGEPANRQFYLTEGGRQIFYSADVNTNVRSARCVHSQSRSVITYETECGLRIRRTIFILPQEDGMPGAVEAQRVEIENLTDRPRKLRIIFTGMFGITGPSTLANDIVYANVVIESEVWYRNGAPAALTVHHKPAQLQGEKRFALLLNGSGLMDEFCTSISDFIGTGTLEKPELVSKLPNSYSRKNTPFFAMARGLSLEAGGRAVADTFTGMMETEGSADGPFDEALERLLDRYSDPGALQEQLDAIAAFWDTYPAYIVPDTGDARFDAYVGHNLPFQTLYQTYVSRAFAWTQKAYREIGFREIQDIYASMYYMSAAGKNGLIKELLSNWIRNVFRMGYANHNFVIEGKEPGVCSDDSLWLLQAVDRYVKLTGDWGILLEEFDVADKAPEGRPGRRSLLETIRSILLYSGKISVGRNGLPLLDHADWNDTLRLDRHVWNGPEKEKVYLAQLEEKGQPYGTALENTLSESVMNACLLKIAADAASRMAAQALEEGAQAEEALSSLKALADEISADTAANIQAHAWKGDFFARCLINDGREGGYTYLGAGGDGLALEEGKSGTYFLNSYSWTILAGVADEKQIAIMLDKVESELRTDAGLKLCTIVDFDRLGIQTGTALYFPGDRENGGVFKHAAMMATVASLQAARWVKDEELARRLSDLAYFMISRTVPYRTLDDPFVLKGNPRFCTQYNNSETGENIGPMLSGTASWLSLAVYETFGIASERDTIAFAPMLQPGRTSISYTVTLGDTVIDVEVKAQNGAIRPSEKTVWIYDGRESGSRIAKPHDGKHHTMKICL